MELLLSAFLLVLCKKVPVECEVKKIDKLHEKVKILNPPSSVSNAKPDSAVVRLIIAKEAGKEID